MANKFLTVEEVTKLINLSKPSVYRLTSQKKIPHIKLAGKILFPEDVLMKWINSKFVPVVNI